MNLYFNADNAGFYDTDIHGSRSLQVPDPRWVRPNKWIDDPTWVRPQAQEPNPEWAEGADEAIPEFILVLDSAAQPAQVEVPDEAAEPPMIEVDNPHCQIPASAKAISAELFAAVVTHRPPGKMVVADTDGLPMLADPPAPPITADGLCTQIDTAADAARRIVAGDPLRATEYERAATEAQAFAAAGYPADAVPRTVSAWAIGGRTAQQAADSILTEAAQYNEALYRLRETRLQAKELVREAMQQGNPELAQDIAFETIASIQAAVAGIGNNA